MAVIIGVEEALTNVQEALRDKGYEVKTIKNEQDVQGCDCCVVTDSEMNAMGINDTMTKAPVIDAKGMSAEDIVKEVASRM
nr:YkuS family protein [Heyndrickxia coagulans]